MVNTIYQYSVTGSIAAGKVNSAKLSNEIRKSTITISLAGVTVNSDILDIEFRDVLPTSGTLGNQELILSGVLSTHDGIATPNSSFTSEGSPIVSLEKTQIDGAPLIAIQGRMGSEAIYATHNLCDKTTWYSDSVRNNNISLIQSGSVWYPSGSAKTWIDMTHGKIFDEETLIKDQKTFAAAVGTEQHGYEVIVTVSGVLKTELPAFQTTGGDYTIDYVNGIVTPISGQDWSGQTNIVSFSEDRTSKWILEPLPGKVLTIEKAEVQFSNDVSYDTSLIFDILGYAAVFAPQYIQSNGGPLPDDARVSIGNTKYKTLDQMVDEAVGSFPQVPAMGGPIRGFTIARNIFQFNYGTVRKLYSSLGLQVQVSLENDVVLGGERATATFYCISSADPGQTAALTELGLI